MSLVTGYPGFLEAYSDGSVKRFAPEIAPPSAKSSDACKSKDVIIDPLKPVTARLFVPQSPSLSDKLPVLVHFHGGGFCMASTTWLGYHHFLSDFSVASQSIVLSVDYRLALEHRLPTAYEDCYDSLKRLHNQARSEPWLQQADLSRVFLSGDSADGNIAHHVTLKAIQNNTLDGDLKIKGIIPIHAYFESEKSTEKEKAEEDGDEVRSNDMFWRLSIPEDSKRDYYGCNFEKTKACESDWSKFPAIQVHLAGKDFLKERGVLYAEFMKEKGAKEVEMVEAEEERHIFHVLSAQSEATRLLQTKMTRSFNTH